MSEPIRVLYDQSPSPHLALLPGTELGVGGQATVYPVPGAEDRVAKVYHRPTGELDDKLRLMRDHPPAGAGVGALAWPEDVLRDSDGRVVGLLLPRVAGKVRVFELYNPVTRRDRCPLFHYGRLHRAARNLVAVFQGLHEAGYVAGDVNESNVLVGEDGRVTVIDTDSFQVRDPRSGLVHRCLVGRPEFTPPELQGRSFAETDRTPEHDRFGLGVLVFQMLMEGTHPFAGRYPGGAEPSPVEERIAAGDFPYARQARGTVSPARTAPPFHVLDPGLRELFLRCFEDGHRDPGARPPAAEWRDALVSAEAALVACPRNGQHRFGVHLDACPWCERARRLGGRDPFPSRSAVERGEHLHRPAASRRAAGGRAAPPPRAAPSVRSQPPAPAALPPGKGFYWAAAGIAFLGGLFQMAAFFIAVWMLMGAWRSMSPARRAVCCGVLLFALTLAGAGSDSGTEDEPEAEAPIPEVLAPIDGSGEPTGVSLGLDPQPVDRPPELLEPERLVAAVTALEPASPATEDPERVTALRFVVDETGAIDPASVQALPALDLAALEVLKLALGDVRFRPAEHDGHPVGMQVGVPLLWTRGRARPMIEAATWNVEPGPDRADSVRVVVARTGAGPAEDGAASEERPHLLNEAEVQAAMARLYPPALRWAGVTGRTQLRFVVDVDGRVHPGTISVLSTSHPEFAEASVSVAAWMRFSPARVDGRVVPVLVRIPITWTLERQP